MCGIVGIISKEGATDWRTRQKIMEQMIIADTFRGHHSTGMFAVNKDTGTVNSFKRAVPGWDFVELRRAQSMLQNMDNNVFTVAHNRWATRGLVTNQNAHPFQHGHIIGVHNGDTPKQDFPKGRDFEVDSDALFATLAEMGAEKTIEMISGAFTLVWYDTILQSLHVIRNSERPLFFAQDNRTKEVYFASEDEMLDWILGRNKIFNYNMFSAEVGLEYIFPLDNPYDNEVIKRELKPSFGYTWRPANNGTNTTTKSTSTSTKNRQLPSLSALGLKHRQQMSVGVIEFLKYREGSSLGHVQCMQIDEPNHIVLIHGLDERDYLKLEQVLDVEITGTRLCEDGEVQLNAIVPKEVPKRNVLQLPQQQETLYEGPYGKVSRKRFEELVRDGCGNCSDPVPLRDHASLDWVGDAPICIQCQQFDDFNEVFGK